MNENGFLFEEEIKMMTAASKFTSTMKKNPILKAVLCFVALIALYFGGMGIYSTLKPAPFEKALEPIRLIGVIIACVFSSWRVYMKANRA